MCMLRNLLVQPTLCVPVATGNYLSTKVPPPRVPRILGKPWMHGGFMAQAQPRGRISPATDHCHFATMVVQSHHKANFVCRGTLTQETNSQVRQRSGHVYWYIPVGISPTEAGARQRVGWETETQQNGDTLPAAR